MHERIVDANLNRLAEGLRVVEDVCRFGLDETAAARRLKTLRRDATRLRVTFGMGLLSRRDSVGDPGRRRIAEPIQRTDLAAVVGASFGRAGESLRVIEEMAKLTNPDAARLAKAMRFEVYDLAKAVLPRLDRSGKIERLRGLYLILTHPKVGYERLAEIAVRARVGAIQLRAKELGGAALLELAKCLREITRGSRTLFFVNDRPDIAALCDADGVHLGQTDLAVTDARRIVGEHVLVGKSTHNLRQMASAVRERPDYVAVGPVFATQSKVNPDPVLGLDKARRLCERAGDVPAVAIGGIDEPNLPDVLKLGVRSYALIGHVGDSPHPLATIRRLQRIERQYK